MEFLGPRGGYILASYLATALILGAMIVLSIAAHRRAKAALAKIEPRDG
jgi:heme exporter protein CcmD